jgi:hypothetical protein
MRHDPASGAPKDLGVIMLRSLKMHGMAQAVTELMEQGSPAFEAAVPVLSQLLKAELAEREVRSIAYHMKAARFPAYKDLTGFDFAASEVNEATVRQLHKGSFLDAAENVVLIGGPGTGKTHVATAIGIQIIEHHRRKVRFFSTIELVNALEQEKARGKAGQIAEGLMRLDLVILDELGYLPFSASGGALVRRGIDPPDQFLILLTPSPEQALRAHQRNHHHQSQLQRMGHGLRRCQDDHSTPRPPHPPLPHPRDRQRQLPLQGKHRRRRHPEKEGGHHHLDTRLSPTTLSRGASLLGGNPGSVPRGNQQRAHRHSFRRALQGLPESLSSDRRH